MKTFNIISVILCWSLITQVPASGQSSRDSAEKDAVSTITQIYETVSGSSEADVDWEKVRSFFIEDAIIFLRTSREGSTQFTLDEFIQDFKDFYNNPAVRESGFREEVLGVNAQVYGDAAAIGVVYRAGIPNSDRAPQKGIDFWLLTRKDNSWKVVGVTNEILPPGEPVPGMFAPPGQ